MKTLMACLAIGFAVVSSQAQTSPGSVSRTQRLFERLTGNPLTLRNPKFRNIIRLVDKGSDLEARRVSEQ